uniref:Uncharacterized protein n=1 Tax=viral metagenome TaxID=1070528 RepID=A0A6H1ZY42_9ZZZZ
MEGIFILLGVLLGYYLGKRTELNKEIVEKIKELKTKPYGTPFVVRTDEAKLEREKLREQEEEEADVSLKKVLSKMPK